MNTSTPVLAVLGRQTLAVSDGRTLPVRGPCADARILANAAARQGIQQLWLAGASPAPLDFGARSETPGAWDFRPSPKHGDVAWAWVHGILRGTDTTLDIAQPHLDRESPWRDSGDARVLLAGLMRYAECVGVPYGSSPGATAARLLRELHTGPRTVAMEPLAAFPDPAISSRIQAEQSLAWMRSLTADERATCRYLHAYDKNGAYLGACSSLSVGIGEATRLPGHMLSAEHRKLPGYFLIDADESTRAIPSHHAGRTLAGEIGHWVTTPTLTQLYERGATVTVHTAYVWPDKHRPLTPWYERLRDARTTLVGSVATADRLALAAVKATYAAFSGYLSSTLWPRAGDAFYRPDIRDLIIATARANLIRRVDLCVAAGAVPVAIGGVDTVYFVSSDPDPVRACPSALPLGTGLGQWKVKATVALGDVLEVFDNPGGRLGDLDKRIKASPAVRHE